MTEELKVIIRAETEEIKKKLQDVQSQLKGVGSGAGAASSKFSVAMKAVGKAAAVAVKAIAGIVTAIITTSKVTEKYREIQQKLIAGFASTGKSAEQAKQTYAELYRFMGEEDAAAEAANHLALLADTQEELAEWTNIAQGVYATFGDSLKVESLTEAANETARVGKVTGAMADALNWAGVSEDAMNAALAQTTSLQEREALLRSTLNGLYSDASRIYEENNKTILESRDTQLRFNEAMAKVGEALTPASNAIINLGAILLNALAPALNIIIPYVVSFVNAIAEAFTWVSNLFSALTGETTKATQTIASSVSGATSSIGNAASGAGALTQGLEDATAAAKDLKKQTAGFDELNVVSSGSSTGSGGIANPGGIAGGGGGYTPAISMGGFNSALDGGAAKANEFANKIKNVFSQIGAAVSTWGSLFTPTFEAWRGAFDTISQSWNLAKDNFVNGGISIGESLLTLGDYILNEFTPNVVNSFSVNIAPLIGDVLGFAVQELGLQFEWLGGKFQEIMDDIIIPYLEMFEGMTIDVFDIVGGNWAYFGEDIMGNASKALESFREILDGLYYKCIKPVADMTREAWEELWDNTLEPLVDYITECVLDISNDLLILYNEVIAPIAKWLLDKIYPDIVRVVGFVLDVINSITTGVAGVINGVMSIIRGLIKFITGVFTGDWKKAWEGVKLIFKGVFDSLVSIIKTPLNLIIDAINVLISGVVSGVNTAIKAINRLSFTVPDWVPGIGGNKFGFNIKELTAPKIPKLATGGIVTSATQILAGERGREAILPLENNTGWMDALADRIAARNSTPSKIVLQLDGKELGWANINSINQITKQTGKIQLAII